MNGFLEQVTHTLQGLQEPQGQQSSSPRGAQEPAQLLSNATTQDLKVCEQFAREQNDRILAVWRVSIELQDNLRRSRWGSLGLLLLFLLVFVAGVVAVEVLVLSRTRLQEKGNEDSVASTRGSTSRNRTDDYTSDTTTAAPGKDKNDGAPAAARITIRQSSSFLYQQEAQRPAQQDKSGREVDEDGAENSYAKRRQRPAKQQKRETGSGRMLEQERRRNRVGNNHALLRSGRGGEQHRRNENNSKNHAPVDDKENSEAVDKKGTSSRSRSKNCISDVDPLARLTALLGLCLSVTIVFAVWACCKAKEVDALIAGQVWALGEKKFYKITNLVLAVDDSNSTSGSTSSDGHLFQGGGATSTSPKERPPLEGEVQLSLVERACCDLSAVKAVSIYDNNDAPGCCATDAQGVDLRVSRDNPIADDLTWRRSNFGVRYYNEYGFMVRDQASYGCVVWCSEVEHAAQLIRDAVHRRHASEGYTAAARALDGRVVH
ncbi:unnamed protein product [Amoebophrya sp. A120]|nr:unnamed protein product [Amoebophrya sp. A120]|eukprot:GSA120T00000668001.1